jgi:hypothetical protein
MLLQRSFFVVALLASVHFPLASTFAQSLKNPRVQGVVVYKKHGFLPDTEALAYEYTQTYDRAGVLRFNTFRGTNVTVHPKSDAVFVPYPGRGFDSKADAITLLDFAKLKYPQYTRLWKNLQIAWQNESRYAVRGLDAAQRARNKEVSDAWREKLESRQQNPVTSTGGLPSANGTGTGDLGGGPNSPTERAKPDAEKPVEVTAEGAEEGNSTNSDADSKVFERSIEMIRKYYKEIGELSR